MGTTSEELCTAIGRKVSAEFADAVQKIEHCIGQLTEDQIWWRPAPEMNSIGNLILHLCGNVGQWIVAGVGGADDTRNRPQEFAERGPIPQVELLQHLTETINAASAVLSRVTAETLLGERHIQGFEVTGLQAIIESVAHFRGHTQEIVHLTRSQLGDRYKYQFVPQTPEQGAPAD